MRVVAGTLAAASIRLVWHCTWARSLTTVIWVDDETMQYMEWTGQGDQTAVRQANKIVITSMVVYIDPTDDFDFSTNDEQKLTEEMT